MWDELEHWGIGKSLDDPSVYKYGQLERSNHPSRQRIG